MERLEERHQIFVQVLSTLDELIQQMQEIDSSHKYYKTLRDSMIQRFEYSIDAFWKILKSYLEVKHGLIPPASPKGILKMALDLRIFSNNDYANLVRMIEDRNLTSHAYNSDLAQRISEAIPSFYAVLKRVSDNLEV